MIVSEYTLDLYCDHPNHDKSSREETFFNESKSECWKEARNAGWKLNSKDWTCICPKCNKKDKIIKIPSNLVSVTELTKNPEKYGVQFQEIKTIQELADFYGIEYEIKTPIETEDLDPEIQC